MLSDREDPKGRDLLLSVVDPDARKGQRQGFFEGYLLDISMDADSELITSLNGLIEKEERAHQNDINEVSIDGIGWREEMLHTLDDPNAMPRCDNFIPASNASCVM